MTPTPTTDAMRARYRAAIDARPPLTAGQHAQAQVVLQLAAENLREAYKALAGRPDLADAIGQAGRAVVALQARIQLEVPHGRH